MYVGYMGVMGMYRLMRLDRICLHIHIFPFAKTFYKMASLAILSKEILFCVKNVYFDASKSLNKTIETGEMCVSGLISLLLMKQMFLFVKLLDLLVNQVSVPLCRERLYRCVICEIKKIILGF